MSVSLCHCLGVFTLSHTFSLIEATQHIIHWCYKHLVQQGSCWALTGVAEKGTFAALKKKDRRLVGETDLSTDAHSPAE